MEISRSLVIFNTMKEERRIQLKKVLITVIAATVFTVVSVWNAIAVSPVPTDFEILTELFSSGIQKIIAPQMPSAFEKSRKNAHVSYSRGITLSAETKEYFESILTKSGFSITADRNNADYFFTVSVTDVRVILVVNEGSFDRTAQLNVHVKCEDSSNTVLFAGGNVETYHDTIAKKSVRLSNNSRKFSRNVKRHLIRTRFNRIRIISLLTVSAALAYFAFD
ncbi:hypothetical protein ACFL6K_05270 [Candidatus Latescibacterota bacterium]